MNTLPNVYKYQYKYFHPTPILPIVANPGNRWSFRYGGDCVEKPWTHHRCGDTSAQNEFQKLRNASLNKIMPWRNSSPEFKPCSCDHRTNGSFENYSIPRNAVASHIVRTNACKGESYSSRDWNWNTHELCAAAMTVHNAVQVVQDESKKCVQEVSKEQQRRSNDTVEDLGSRIHDIRKLAQELQSELEQSVRQSHELGELKQRILQMIKNIEKPLEMSRENLITRQIRQGVELVHDEVEKALLNEVVVFERHLHVLFNDSEKVNCQLARLRDSRHEIEVDIEKKVQARDTDRHVQSLSLTSSDIGSIAIPHQFAIHSSPTSWIQYTQNILQRSQNERNLSQTLEIEVTKDMLAAAEAASSAWNSTNSALRSRVAEIGGAKGQLERHIQKLGHDIRTLHLHIEEVQDSLRAKAPVLQLAQSRLDKRTERPGVELCRDGATLALNREIHVVKNGLDLLTSKEMEMKTTLEHLLKTKSTLERDWKLKNLAISVDNEKCLALRLSNPISAFSETRSRRMRDNAGNWGYQAPRQAITFS